MNDAREVLCRPRWRRTLWFFVGLGAAGMGVAVVGTLLRDELAVVWLGVGLLLAPLGVAALYAATARVRADAYGLRSWTLLSRWSVPWQDVADLRIQLRHERNHRARTTRRVSVLLCDGGKRLLPLPHGPCDDPDFDAELDVLRALHRRHGTPRSSHLPVLTYRTVGRTWAGALSLCVLLLAGAGVAAWFVPNASSQERAWVSAAPCTSRTPADERDECLTTLSAEIERTEAGRPKHSSWLYFTDSRPQKRLAVSREAALAFDAGDSVELTVWRREVMEVAGEGHVWRNHIADAGALAVVAAAVALAAVYPGTKVLLRLRARRRPDDEVLPSALPFAGALVGTAVWLLPLCYRHPTGLASSEAVAWAVAGSLVTLGLFVRAWYATRVRTPAADAEDAAAEVSAEPEREAFLAARFLEHTEYNPHGFGTHIVVGDGPPAVTPHPGPGRFAARPIPVERLTVRDVRRVRGDDGDTVPRGWHIAELDDAGTPVRLAAAPDDLARLVRELGSARTSAQAAGPRT
ncbi:PH domain-containing protein [Streptomyces smyrnaeus]|uniref:PH domain-containing protein n=1 Tax=Streptomyces smyrnaeus TaxID=1387713 RepID=A0ABS3XUW2_9ACTN|nr:PH domain-containing protein [Streptomyces smyrnaeus]MBO8199170.1 PH domain-containing protein [Streptomyces smyrnaeus]